MSHRTGGSDAKRAKVGPAVINPGLEQAQVKMAANGGRDGGGRMDEVVTKGRSVGRFVGSAQSRTYQQNNPLLPFPARKKCLPWCRFPNRRYDPNRAHCRRRRRKPFVAVTLTFIRR